MKLARVARVGVSRRAGEVARVGIVALVGVLALTTAAIAADPAPTLKSCNQAADAKNLTGKERAAFIKECLAGHS